MPAYHGHTPRCSALTSDRRAAVDIESTLITARSQPNTRIELRAQGRRRRRETPVQIPSAASPMQTAPAIAMAAPPAGPGSRTDHSAAPPRRRTTALPRNATTALAVTPAGLCMSRCLSPAGGARGPRPASRTARCSARSKRLEHALALELRDLVGPGAEPLAEPLRAVLAQARRRLVTE